MTSPAPIYTAENCTPAYQLNWAISFFANAPLPNAESWAQPLRDAVAKDDIRVLEHRLPSSRVVQFLASTKPAAAPSFVLQRLKGRLQYLLRDRMPQAFRRNYRLESVGSAGRDVIEAYVQDQLAHHPMADAWIQERFQWVQIVAEDVDLSAVRFTAHGQFIYNLHVVLEHADGWCAVELKFLRATCEMIRGVCRKRGFLLSRAGIVASHLHLAIGCGIEDAPESVCLCLLNNLAYAHGMKPIYRFGYYAGTFGNFDLGALRQARTGDEGR
jgi:hypothetical protein